MMKLEEEKPRNNFDSKCQIILRYLNQVHESAITLSKQLVGVRDIQNQLRGELNRKDISRTLDYLVDATYIVKLSEKFTTPKGKITDTNIKYKISALGIASFEHPEIFKADNRFISGINISHVENLVIIGKNNSIVINKTFEDLGKQLEDIKQDIQQQATIQQENQLEILALINSLQCLLITTNPDKTLVQRIHDAILDKLNSLPEKVTSNLLMTAFTEKVLPLLQSLLN